MPHALAHVLWQGSEACHAAERRHPMHSIISLFPFAIDVLHFERVAKATKIQQVEENRESRQTGQAQERKGWVGGRAVV